MTLNDVTAISEEPVILNSAGTVDVNGGDFKTTGTKSCFVNNSANLTINKGSTTEGTGRIRAFLYQSLRSSWLPLDDSG